MKMTSLRLVQEFWYFSTPGNEKLLSSSNKSLGSGGPDSCSGPPRAAGGVQFAQGCAVIAQHLCGALFLLGHPNAPSSSNQVLLAALWLLGEPFCNSSGVPVCYRGRQGCLLESVAPARGDTPTSSSSDKTLPVGVGTLMQLIQGGCEIKQHCKKMNVIYKVTGVSWRGEALPPSYWHLLAPDGQRVSAAAACEPSVLMHSMFPWSRTTFLFGLPDKLSSGSCSGREDLLPASAMVTCGHITQSACKVTYSSHYTSINPRQTNIKQNKVYALWRKLTASPKLE